MCSVHCCINPTLLHTHCCTPCGWMMMATVALATVRKRWSLAMLPNLLLQLWINTITPCVYAQVKDLTFCYILLTVECLSWYHWLNITERLTTGCYECMHGEKEWYLENVWASFELSLLVFLGICTMNALHTRMPSLSASFCHILPSFHIRRCACIVFIGSSWRWGLWVYSSTDYVFIDTTLYRILAISLLSYVSCRVNGHNW